MSSSAPRNQGKADAQTPEEVGDSHSRQCARTSQSADLTAQQSRVYGTDIWLTNTSTDLGLSIEPPSHRATRLSSAMILTHSDEEKLPRVRGTRESTEHTRSNREDLALDTTSHAGKQSQVRRLLHLNAAQNKVHPSERVRDHQNDHATSTTSNTRPGYGEAEAFRQSMVAFAEERLSHGMSAYHEKNIDQILNDLMALPVTGPSEHDTSKSKRPGEVATPHHTRPADDVSAGSVGTDSNPLQFLAGRAQSRIGSADQRAKAHQTLLLVATLLASVSSAFLVTDSELVVSNDEGAAAGHLRGAAMLLNVTSMGMNLFAVVVLAFQDYILQRAIHQRSDPDPFVVMCAANVAQACLDDGSSKWLRMLSFRMVMTSVPLMMLAAVVHVTAGLARTWAGYASGAVGVAFTLAMVAAIHILFDKHSNMYSLINEYRRHPEPRKHVVSQFMARNRIAHVPPPPPASSTPPDTRSSSTTSVT
eukprot:m.798206 g.798206  ORF g.798206 m.798206 type:complete len:476 (-) comp23349_c0_seq35:1722-3149(-)